MEMNDVTGTRVAAMLETCPEAAKAKYTRMAEKAAGKSYASAVRLKCMECCCWVPSEVEQCAITGCALHGFRSRNEKKRRIPGRAPSGGFVGAGDRGLEGRSERPERE